MQIPHRRSHFRATHAAPPPFLRDELTERSEVMMLDASALRRRWVMGSAGAIGLMIATAARARDEVKKNADDVLTPAEILARNNAVLARIMLIYENGMRRANDGEDIDPLVFGQSAEVARDFFHNYHEKAEQELVYPAFRKAGRMVDLVSILITQQGIGRTLTDSILAAAPKSHAREQRDAMDKDIKSFIKMYRPHLAREETDILPTLHLLVTPEEYGRMAAELLKREREAFSQDGFEAAVKKVAEIETKIGMDDLSQFTPKS
jgi:hemerythrin-like domain-containing protein